MTAKLGQLKDISTHTRMGGYAQAVQLSSSFSKKGNYPNKMDDILNLNWVDVPIYGMTVRKKDCHQSVS